MSVIRCFQPPGNGVFGYGNQSRRPFFLAFAESGILYTPLVFPCGKTEQPADCRAIGIIEATPIKRYRRILNKKYAHPRIAVTYQAFQHLISLSPSKQFPSQRQHLRHRRLHIGRPAAHSSPRRTLQACDGFKHSDLIIHLRIYLHYI